MQNEFELPVVKVGILGTKQSGKTSLLLNFSGEGFSESTFINTGVDFKNRTMDNAKLQLWDINQSRERTIQSTATRSLHAVIIAVDLTDRDPEALRKVEALILETNRNKSDAAPIILVGTKADKKENQIISEDDLQALAAKHNLGKVYMTSAKTGANVQELFHETAQRVLDARAPQAKQKETKAKKATPEKHHKEESSFNPFSKLKSLISGKSSSSSVSPPSSSSPSQPDSPKSGMGKR